MPSPVEHLNPRHYKIIDAILKGVMSVDEMAAHFGMTSTNICNIKRSPSFQHELALRRASINEKMDTQLANIDDPVTKVLRDGAKKAAEALMNGIEKSKDENIVFKSAADVLDRAGYPKVTRQVGTPAAVVVINEADAARLKETMEMDRV